MLIVCTKIISARPKLLQKPRDFQVFLIPEKESSSNSDNSYDDEVGDDTAVDDDTTNSNFEIELPVISSSPNQDTSTHAVSIPNTYCRNILSNRQYQFQPSSCETHLDVVLAVTPIQPSRSIFMKQNQSKATPYHQ